MTISISGTPPKANMSPEKRTVGGLLLFWNGHLFKDRQASFPGCIFSSPGNPFFMFFLVRTLGFKIKALLVFVCVEGVPTVRNPGKTVGECLESFGSWYIKPFSMTACIGFRYLTCLVIVKFGPKKKPQVWSAKVPYQSSHRPQIHGHRECKHRWK